MPLSKSLLQPRLQIAAISQRLAQPHAFWGVALGGLAATAVAGSAYVLPRLQDIWHGGVSTLLLAAGAAAGVQTAASLPRALAAWVLVLSLLAAVALIPVKARRLAALAGAATVAVLGFALGSRALAGIALDPVLPLALLLGGIAGRLGFERWQQLVVQRSTERQRQLRQAVAHAKSEFLVQLTREMRTPVNAVVGIADLLTETGLDAEQHRHLVVFRRAADALTAMLEDLADLARIEAGHVELKSEEIRLASLLHEQIAQIRREAEAKGLQIQLTMADHAPRVVRGDAHRLGQVLSHLLSHSVRATRQGRIGVEVRPTPRHDDTLRFVVTDTSLSPVTGTLAGFLEPFSGAAAERVRQGPGIGLTLVRGLAELMGGRLSVRHAPGRGTTTVLSVALPAVLEAEPGTAVVAYKDGADPLATAFRTPLSVLLVDDNVSTRELIESMLDKRRYTVVRCSNGREALQALDIAPYDIVLMDLNMPELDGWSALRILCRQETERKLPRTAVIALGTAPLDVERQRCLAAGFDEHLCKPLRKSRLLETIDRTAATAAGLTPPPVTPTDDLRPDQRAALDLLGRDGLIDVPAALESLGGDATLYLDAIEHLVPALSNWPSRFQDALNRRDFERGRLMALDMQSILDVVAAAACAAALGRMAEALGAPQDARLRQSAMADLDRQLQPLMKILQQTVELIRSARQERLRREQGHNSAF